MPDAVGCCGFAGDRGMLHPELTASASSEEAAEVARRSYHEHADGPGSRHIPARTDSFRRTLAWWKMCCRIVGMDDDLSNW